MLCVGNVARCGLCLYLAAEVDEAVADAVRQAETYRGQSVSTLLEALGLAIAQVRGMGGAGGGGKEKERRR